MAAIARRTFANIRDEVLKRIGRSTDSAASSRVEYWVDAVYRNLCLTYHHYELDEVAEDQALAAAAVSLALPSNCYALIAVVLKSNAGVEIHRLTPDRANYLIGGSSATAAQPKSYARFKSTIYFSAPADVAYKLDIYYYRHPTAPDFAGSATCEWDRLWDEYLTAGASDAALRGYWSAENAAPHAESLAAFLGRVVNPPLASGVLRDEQDSPTIDNPHGGAQG